MDMPSTHKRTPPTALKKKTTASARSKVDMTKKPRKKQNLHHNDGSYVGESAATASSRVSIQEKGHTPISQSHNGQTNQQILELLQDLKASNDTLSHRIDRLEKNSSVDSTPVTSPQGNIRSQDLPRMGYMAVNSWAIPAQDQQLGPSGGADSGTDVARQLYNNGRFSQNTVGGHGKGQNMSQAPVPPIEQMRRDAGISAAVSHILTLYDLQAPSEVIQGKSARKNSG